MLLRNAAVFVSVQWLHWCDYLSASQARIFSSDGGKPCRCQHAGLFHKFSIDERREAAELARLSAHPLLYWLHTLMRTHPHMADRRARLRQLTRARQAAERAAQQAARERRAEQQRRVLHGVGRAAGRVLGGLWLLATAAEMASRPLR